MSLRYSIKHFNDLTVFELYKIMRLRQEVFVVEQNCPYLDADGADNISDPTTPAFNGLNFNDGIIDNERFGILGSQHFYRQGN